MSAPDVAPAALMRPTYIGGKGETSIIELWVPVVVLAHLFAAFWLFKTLMLNSPGLQRRARAKTRQMTRLAKHASIKVRGSIGARASLDGRTPPKGGAAAAVGKSVDASITDQAEAQVGGGAGGAWQPPLVAAARQPLLVVF
jgi:hypothetical protein